MARAREAVSKPAIANAKGVVHLNISSEVPEADELRSLVDGMKGVNVDHRRNADPIFNPAVSTAQREAMAIAEHEPGKLYKRNRGMKKMSKSQLHDFAATKGL